MAVGGKRSAAPDPPSRSKKLKTPTQAFIPSSPSQIEGRAPPGNDDQTILTIGQALTSLETVKKHWGKDNGSTKQFEKMLNEKHDEVQKSLQTMKEQFISNKQAFEASLLPILRKALAPIDDQDDSSNHPSPMNATDMPPEPVLYVPTTAAGHQDFITELTSLIQSSYGLINTYRKLKQQDSQSTYPPHRLEDMETDFKKDKQAVLSTIDAGRRVAARDVEAMLADRYHEVRGRRGLTNEDEQKGRMLLVRGEHIGDTGNGDQEDDKENQTPSRGGGMGWGNVAFDASKAVRKLESVGQMQ